MNAREQALARTAKREEREQRRTLTVPKPDVEAPPIVAPVVAPKEKRRMHGEIYVKVSHPEGEFEFALIKDNILANIPRSRLTAAEFRKIIVSALQPLMGNLK